MNVARFIEQRFWVVALLLAATIAALYMVGIDGGFLLDDRPNIINNSALHLSEINGIDDLLYSAYSFGAGEGSRALPMLTFALDYRRAGLDPSAFKITNVLIHGVTCALLAFLSRRLLLTAGWSAKSAAISSLVVAFVWGVHPLQVSSVLYIVQRMQTMTTLFVFLALLFYVKMRINQIGGVKNYRFGALALLFSVFAFACKEDAALLPLYFLVLELTLLNFEAADSKVRWLLRRGYFLFTLLGAGAYFFWVVPEYWSWEPYSGRDFNSVERIMTQGRVLVMYLGQILLPMPETMKFFYDGVEVSRGIIQPWTTLPSLLFIAGLIAWGMVWRNLRPVFAFGILFYFAGHFMTSNVISLDLAYEHRNHLPMVGVLLAVLDLIALGAQRAKLTSRGLAVVFLLLTIPIVAMSFHRISMWGDELSLARYHTEIAPESERAWKTLCTSHFVRSRGEEGLSHLNSAVEACEKGSAIHPQSALLMSSLITYKAMKGDVEDVYWDELNDRLKNVSMSTQNKAILWATLNNFQSGLYKNENQVLRVIETFDQVTNLNAGESIKIAVFIFNETYQPDKAYPYLERAVRLAPGAPAIENVLNKLANAGRHEWVDSLTKARAEAL
ncbi:hypothetical protein [Gilvimarinus xylanilyticus]|uniref:Glycosyltransferase RgtA/B/C/D-like domain-containing protein n=1 Tax=Gilvimarinus xylanilyticus TaxID=2944139 RepID=A0A9X2KX12_9GAMM|nr:hypothetical protein [Gilvimarinus xylanilyticus]MCP8900225.1 hypothetical protein [Gilvimarinus xylanilyticus]